jgi:hypothetical protein
MNPEVRFRVPKHVHQLAQQKAAELGLRTTRGKTGGASELARGALYTYLGLGLPGDLSQLEQKGFDHIRATVHSENDEDPSLLVTVHHRIDPEFRKRRALEKGCAVPVRGTTEFRFPQGELPHFLVPYISLTDRGVPFATINLEGALSPRRHSVGELTSAQDTTTLGELEACLKQIRQKRDARQREEQERAGRLEKGRRILEKWVQTHGSELLKARHSGGFNWLELACEEYALEHLRQLGLSELARLPTTHSLEASKPRFQNVTPQQEPKLESLKNLQRLQSFSDPSLEFQIVKLRELEVGPMEGIQVSLQLPVPGRIHFLTSLIPL